MSFDIIDDAGATALVEEPEPIFDPGDAQAASIDPSDLDQAARAKFYVDDVDVWVTAEAVYYLDPETTLLRLVEHRDWCRHRADPAPSPAKASGLAGPAESGAEASWTSCQPAGIDAAEL